MKMKRVIAILMSALLIASVATGCKGDSDKDSTKSNSSQTASKAEEIDFEYTELDESIVITAYKGSDAEITIPEKVNGKPVTEIAQFAFYGKDFITNVTIPSTVKQIGLEAFLGTAWYENLTDEFVVVGDGILVKYNGNAEDIKLADSIKSIYAGFRGSETLKSITFSENLTHIGDEAFYLCSKLEKVTIPASVAKIGYMAFCNCASLKTIEVSADNPSYVAEDGILYNKAKTELICYPAGKTDKTEFAVSDKVSTIANCAFIGTTLEKITLPESITMLGLYTFNDCKSLREINIPSKVVSIGEAAFYNCPELESIELPDSLADLGTRAFAGCSSLQSVSIPASVKTMGAFVFAGCENLYSIDCGASEKPEGWNDEWISECDADVSWG